MKDENTLRFGALTDTCLHICVDMQRLFADDTDWHTPWMERVLPNAVRIVEAHSAQTIFTRFIPAEEPGQASLGDRGSRAQDNPSPRPRMGAASI